MARHFELAANIARVNHDANGGLFDRDVHTGKMLHGVLLYLMLVTTSPQTTSITSL